MAKKKTRPQRVREPFVAFCYKLEESLVDRWVNYCNTQKPQASYTAYLRLALTEFLDRHEKTGGDT